MVGQELQFESFDNYIFQLLNPYESDHALFKYIDPVDLEILHKYLGVILLNGLLGEPVIL